MLTASFHDSITLGTIIIGVLVGVLFFLSTLKDRQTGRWRDLYTLADEERKELQAELNEARTIISDLKQQVAKLEALQIPVQVVNSLRENAEAAADRQVQILQFFERHEMSAEKRNRAVLGLLQLIADRLGEDPNGH